MESYKKVENFTFNLLNIFAKDLPILSQCL